MTATKLTQEVRDAELANAIEVCLDAAYHHKKTGIAFTTSYIHIAIACGTARQGGLEAFNSHMDQVYSDFNHNVKSEKYPDGIATAFRCERANNSHSKPDFNKDGSPKWCVEQLVQNNRNQIASGFKNGVKFGHLALDKEGNVIYKNVISFYKLKKLNTEARNAAKDAEKDEAAKGEHPDAVNADNTAEPVDAAHAEQLSKTESDNALALHAIDNFREMVAGFEMTKAAVKTLARLVTQLDTLVREGKVAEFAMEAKTASK